MEFAYLSFASSQDAKFLCVEYMAKPWRSESAIVAQLNSQKAWSGQAIGYAFPTSFAGLSGAEKNGFFPFTSVQKKTAVEVLGLWDDLIKPSLVNVGANPQIKFANTTVIDYSQTYQPGSKAQDGSLWINPIKNKGSSGTDNLAAPDRGEWAYFIYVHEIGHALGLNHAGNYDRGSPTYEKDAKYFQDTLQYSVMSYFDAENSNANWVASDGYIYAPQTPMLYDIMAIQKIYGADLKTRINNTTYGYNATTKEDVYNFEINQHPVFCIYDAGGKDTIDNSNSPHACSLNLAPASFSSTDMMTYNISIAANTWIENAVGGLGDDTLWGNSLGNQLDGYAGDDSLFGGSGNDILIGAEGSDQMTGGTGADTFRFRTFSQSAPWSSDLITDFSAAQGDKIDLSAFDANTLGQGKQAFKFIGAQVFSGAGGELRYTNGHVEADVNGDRNADLDIIFQNVISLTRADFIL